MTVRVRAGAGGGGVKFNFVTDSSPAWDEAKSARTENAMANIPISTDYVRGRDEPVAHDMLGGTGTLALVESWLSERNAASRPTLGWHMPESTLGQIRVDVTS